MHQLVNRAILIAHFAHFEQVDKGQNSYIEHPRVVASMVNGDELKIVAWLHDVVEDSQFTLDYLSMIFPHNIIDAIDAITKRDDESRMNYLMRVKSNPIAREVKIADLTHNSDLSRIENPSVTDYMRTARYQDEIKFLREKSDG